MVKYQPHTEGQEATLRALMRADAAYCRREAARQERMKARGPVPSTQQFITDPCYRRDDYMAVPYAVARVRR